MVSTFAEAAKAWAEGEGEMPASRTSELAKELGLDRDRNLAQDCANFYILESLTAHKVTGASFRLDKLEKALSKEYSTYLNVAIGGEVRHLYQASLDWGVHVPEEFEEYLDYAKDVNFERTACWCIWARNIRPKAGYIGLIRMAAEAWTSEEWPESARVGGPKWATIARVEHDYLTGNMKDRIFVDRCFTLQHNYNIVFDKMYQLGNLSKALELQAADDYQGLGKLASPDVQSLWTAHRRKKMAMYDPGWLGIQQET